MTRLRKYPYPYRAALALCSDIDDCGPDRFVEIHEHLNGKLGLDVADSFFFRASPDQLNWRDHRDVVLEGLRRGWIDTLHGYGDFNRTGGFTRAVAAEGLAELKAAGFTLEIFTNHGDVHNAQNVCHTGGRGDVKDAPEYHADLLWEHGVRFVWPTWLTHLVGQDRDSGAWEWTRDYPGASPARRTAATILGAIGFNGFIDPYPGNELVRGYSLRDGRRVYAFRRHGWWRRDDVTALRELIAPSRILQLIAAGGAAIVYVHLGRNWSPIPEFEQLRQFPDLWVARTSRLLRFVAVREGVRWKASGATVTLEPKEGLLLDPLRPADLVGISFEGATTVVFQGRELPVRVHPGPVVEVAA